ncbi:protease complex subunit PrcB family protein [Deinococcus planocerae]|uniref:protease complex subunit PrcB family protein n=1 Tax=Deinococcus planocerae TaxID=1737569 RepID=UPI000C7F1B18|nr:protease complex subunit PrcB family protein [Deinococcus planocerae]
MKTSLTAALLLGAGLLAGCSMTGPGNLRVHEVLLYGGTQERIAWVYGDLRGSAQSSVKLGNTAAELRAQVPDPLAVAGTLSVNGRATYRLPTAAVTPKLAVTRDTQGLFNVTLNEASGTVYFTDGRGWSRLSAPAGPGLRGTAVAGLRGAGNLTDAEADALSAALVSQGPLAVAVLNEAGVPDAPLTVEPTPAEYRRTALYVLPNVRTVALPGTATGTVTITPGTPTPGAGQPGGTQTQGQAQGTRVTFTELASGTNAAATTPAVQVATTQSALSALYNLAYGRQTGVPAAPSLGAGGTAVGVFLGQRPTGGYGVRVVGASSQNGVLTLTAEVRSPGEGSITTQALTSPWTIVRVPGTYREVRVVDAQGRPLPGAGGGQIR